MGVGIPFGMRVAGTLWYQFLDSGQDVVDNGRVGVLVDSQCCRSVRAEQHDTAFFDAAFGYRLLDSVIEYYKFGAARRVNRDFLHGNYALLL